MINIQSICVYCGASDGVDQKFVEAAHVLGQHIGANGKTLVYGGCRTGLMGAVANGALSAQGKVIGIIPHTIKDAELEHTGLTELHTVDTMHTRKMMMAKKADAFVVLPGGVGTLEEFFEVWGWNSLKIHDKPIVLVNVEGYWNTLLKMIDTFMEQGFIGKHYTQFLHVVEDPEHVLDVLSEAPEPKFGLKIETL